MAEQSWPLMAIPPARGPAPIPVKASSRNHLGSLDGLRALSIVLVILSHSAGALGIDHRLYLFWYIGHLGVSIFFVISGLLISWLMIREKEVTGRVSLRDFYIRRALRILPVFWVFLLCVLGLKWAHVIAVSGIDSCGRLPSRAIIPSGCMDRNIRCGWTIHGR